MLLAGLRINEKKIIDFISKPCPDTNSGLSQGSACLLIRSPCTGMGQGERFS